MLGIKKVLVFLLLSCISVSLSAGATSVFNDAEVHETARAYKTMVERPENFNAMENIPMSINGSEFRGYVAGTLESHERLEECSKTKSLQDVAYKAALMIETFDRNDSVPSSLTILLGVVFACDDSMWNKKP